MSSRKRRCDVQNHKNALHYVNETHVDALAVSIGTTHGQFKWKAKLNLLIY